jgi:hypothetical protein
VEFIGETASIGPGDTPPRVTLGFSELPLINLELAPLEKVKAVNAAATAAARMYLKLNMAS